MMKTKTLSLENLNTLRTNTLMEHLGIEYTECGEDYLCAKMPVNHTTMQPFGILHGGAVMALAESTGSALSAILINLDEFEVRGIEINGNHVYSVKSGVVYAKAKPVHLGKTTQVIEIRITDDQGKLVSLCRMTNIVLKKEA